MKEASQPDRQVKINYAHRATVALEHHKTDTSKMEKEYGSNSIILTKAKQL